MNLQRHNGEVSSTTDGTASQIAELCPQCSTVDIAALFESPFILFPLPNLQSMILNTACPLCKLCSKAIRTIWKMSPEDISSIRPIRCWLRNALWAGDSNMCGMLGTDWKPGQYDSRYTGDTVRHFITTLHLVLDDQENDLVPDSVEDISHEASGTPKVARNSQIASFLFYLFTRNTTRDYSGGGSSRNRLIFLSFALGSTNANRTILIQGQRLCWI
jgi:hypothetical protein